MQNVKKSNDARIFTRIDSNVKQMAQEELAKHGLTMSEYLRIVVTSVAYDGLPKHFGLPNADVMASLQEVADDLSGKHPLPSASTPEELEKMLNE